MSSKIEYAVWWLEIAEEKLLDDPSNTLSYHVMENISGGRRGWEPEMEEVFLKPETLEEALLRLRVCSILEIALANIIRGAWARIQRDNIGPPCSSWKAMDIGLAFSLAERIAEYHPLCAVRAKIQLNLLSKQLGETLLSISNSPKGIYFQANVGIKW